jgi:hypothetical protein
VRRFAYPIEFGYMSWSECTDKRLRLTAEYKLWLEAKELVTTYAVKLQHMKPKVHISSFLLFSHLWLLSSASDN